MKPNILLSSKKKQRSTTMPYTTKSAEIMTPNVVTISPTASVTDAVRLICEHGISGLPVVDRDGKLVGIITKTDLITLEYETQFERLYEVDLKSILGSSEFNNASIQNFSSEADSRDITLVETIMKRSVITASPETPLPVIAKLMYENNIHRIVITENDRVVGIITSMDLLKLIVQKSAWSNYHA